MRDMVAARLEVAADDELAILAVLGKDLPGAVVAKELRSVPLREDDEDDPGSGDEALSVALADQGFSLAGVQLKFSMIAKGARLTLPASDEEGDFIVKPPSPAHPSLPLNEFAMMSFARAAGVDVPPIRLVGIDKLRGVELPATAETHAYAIARFDRTATGRIHTEDFAQVLELRPTEKYGATNYDTMARVILGVFPDPLRQIEQMVRRLVVNLLVGNADAHVKNWSVIYPDGRTPELAPAYDIVCTLQYARNANAALNMARVKMFYDIDDAVWRRFARRVGIAEKFVVSVVEETVGLARERWPALWQELELTDALRETLMQHWLKLPKSYRWDSHEFA
jgi:serine/threonine-protein kinase HipA